MKITIFTPNDNTGGTERVSAIYAHSLSSEHVHVIVCSIFKPLSSFDSNLYPHLHSSLYLAYLNKIFRPFILFLAFLYYRLLGYHLFIQGEYLSNRLFLTLFGLHMADQSTNCLVRKKPFLYSLFSRSISRHICLFPSEQF